MFKNVNAFFLLILLMFFCTSCKEDRCGATKVNRYHFTAGDTMALPYDGNDSLYFELRDSSGSAVKTDILLFVGQGKTYYWEGQETEGNCPENNAGQVIEYKLLCTTLNDSIRIKFIKTSYTTIIEVRFKNDLSVLTAGTLYGDMGYEYDQITLAGTTYYNVSTSSSYLQNLMMSNVAQGILYFQYKPCCQFTLLNLK